ncbi:MAG TPA: DNA polymerase III subunit gamma/tau [Chthoniobacterales bacterium]
MSYRVFARKYRPQVFEEVVGQEHITRTLQNAIRQNRLAQAYLLVGPRGTGKTSTARILAKALNCEKGSTPNPCGECVSCREIAEGNSLDVLEIDGASNNSVDNIRELRENAAYAPAKGPYKVYYIDEVHMLSAGAFNALLKTLEEPPPHVKFLFATTEVQKVPATIASRCQRFDLRRIPDDRIAKHLLQIAEKEKIEIEETAVQAIARGADGGLRDAESMLDQVVAFCGERISAADVFEVFGFTPAEVVESLAARILAADAPGALEVVNAQSDAGKDLAQLLGGLIVQFRDTLVGQVRGAAAPGVSRDKLLDLLEHLADSESRMKWAPDKKLQLDVAVIKAVHLIEQASLSEVIDALSDLRGGVLPSLPSPPAAPAAAKPTPPEPVAPPPAKPAPVEIKVASVDPKQAWEQTVHELSAASAFKYAWLEHGNFLDEVNGVFRAEYPAEHESMQESPWWMDILSELAAKLSTRTGIQGCRVEFRFSRAEPPAAPPAPAPAAPEAKEAPPVDPMAEFRKDPLIQKALAMFKAEIVTP